MRALQAIASPPPRHDEALELVTRCQGGDRAAFRGLFDLYHRRVYATVYHLVRHKDEVDDVVQKVFLEVHRSIVRFEGRALFSTWLTRVAIHVARAHERKLRLWNLSRQRSEEAAREGFLVFEGGRNEAPDVALATAERAHAAREVLERMPPKKREILVLAELHDLSAPEIAEILDIPPATARTRLFYARREFERRARRHVVLAELLGTEGP